MSQSTRQNVKVSRKNIKRILMLTAASTVALMARQEFASAAPSIDSWTGGNAGTDTAWGDGLNWLSGNAPNNGDDLVFGTTSGLTNFNEPTGVTTSNLLTSVNSITFAASAGAFIIDSAGNSNTSFLTLGSGGIINNSANTETFNQPIAIAANTTFNAAAGNIKLSLSNPSIGPGATLFATGSHNILVGQNTYSQTVNGGTIDLLSSFTGTFYTQGPTPAGTSATVIVSGGTFSSYQINPSGNTPITLEVDNSSSTLSVIHQFHPLAALLTLQGSAGTISITANSGFAFAKTPVLKAGANVAILGGASTITGTTTGITVNGGTLIMAGANSFIGNTTVNPGGTLGSAALLASQSFAPTASNTFGSSANVVSLNGGTVGGYEGAVVGSATKYDLIDNTISLTASSTFAGTSEYAVDIAPIVGSNAYTLTFDTTAFATGSAPVNELALMGNNTFNGLTKFQSANPSLSTALTLDSTNGGVAVAGNLEIDGQDIGSAHSSGVVLAASNQITAGNSVSINSGYMNFNGFTNNLSGVTMAGGTVLLPGGSSIVGATNLIVGDTAAHSAATLDISGNTIVGGYVLSSGQSLSGNGQVLTGGVSNPLVVGNGGTLKPGDAPGVLTFGNSSANGNVSVAPSANLVFDLSGPNANSDLAAVSGAFSFGGTSLATVNLSLTSVTVPSLGNSATYELFAYGTYSGDPSADLTDDFNILLNGSAPSSPTTVNVIDNSAGNQIDVVVASVPEPASLSLLGLGALGLLGRRRKRRTTNDN